MSTRSRPSRPPRSPRWRRAEVEPAAGKPGAGAPRIRGPPSYPRSAHPLRGQAPGGPAEGEPGRRRSGRVATTTGVPAVPELRTPGCPSAAPPSRPIPMPRTSVPPARRGRATSRKDGSAWGRNPQPVHTGRRRRQSRNPGSVQRSLKSLPGHCRRSWRPPGGLTSVPPARGLRLWQGPVTTSSRQTRSHSPTDRIQVSSRQRSRSTRLPSPPPRPGQRPSDGDGGKGGT